MRRVSTFLKSERTRVGNYAGVISEVVDKLLQTRVELESRQAEAFDAPDEGFGGSTKDANFEDPVQIDQPDGVGAEWARLTINGQEVSRSAHSYAWFEKKLYYSEVLRSQVRPCRVLEWPGNKIIVDDTQNESCFVDASTSKSKDILLVSSNSKSESEVHIMHKGRLECLRQRQQGVQYFAEHAGDWLWFVTNRDEPLGNYRLWRRRLNACEGEWELAPCNNPGWHLEELDVFDWGLLMYERSVETGDQRVRIADVKQGKEISSYNVAPGLHVEPIASGAYNSPEQSVHVYATSPLVQACSFQLGPGGRDSQTLVLEGPQNDESNEMVCERQIVGDAGIPLTLVRPRQAKPDQSNPLLVMSYGAYGEVMAPRYDPSLAALVKDYGFILAYAHVRGGGERGRSWYHAGRGLNKKNTIDDLHNVVRHLQETWTTPEQTCATSMSAGATSLAALVNLEPQLFRAVALNVPFLDVKDAMSDPERPLTVAEYDEWGDPSDDPITHDYIMSYDPLSNIGVTTRAKGSRYPSMLVSCSLADMRVSSESVSEYVQRLRNLEQIHAPPTLLFKWTTESGHIAHDPQQEAVDQAFEHGFFIQELGLQP